MKVVNYGARITLIDMKKSIVQQNLKKIWQQQGVLHGIYLLVDFGISQFRLSQQLILLGNYEK